MLKILFHTPQLSLRGTEIALFDYGDHNEGLLGNRTVVCYPASSPANVPEVVRKFSDRFELFAYDDFTEVDHFIAKHRIALFYALKSGRRDGIVSRVVPSMIHAVFPTPVSHFAGSAFCFISDWLSDVCSNGLVPAVPHIVNKRAAGVSLRERLGIDGNATVFGYYGGRDSFDIGFVRDRVLGNVLRRRADIFFVFLNVAPFTNHDRVLFLDGTADMQFKDDFIATCDAMLHARKLGESFGLACGEFSVANRPIVTYGRSCQRQHLEVLGDSALRYSNAAQLEQLLLEFDRKASARRDWDRYSGAFAPEVIMRRFQQHFIEPALRNGIVDRFPVQVGALGRVSVATKRAVLKFRKLAS